MKKVSFLSNECLGAKILPFSSQVFKPIVGASLRRSIHLFLSRKVMFQHGVQPDPIDDPKGIARATSMIMQRSIMNE